MHKKGTAHAVPFFTLFVGEAFRLPRDGEPVPYGVA